MLRGINDLNAYYEIVQDYFSVCRGRGFGGVGFGEFILTGVGFAGYLGGPMLRAMPRLAAIWLVGFAGLRGMLDWGLFGNGILGPSKHGHYRKLNILAQHH